MEVKSNDGTIGVNINFSIKGVNIDPGLPVEDIDPRFKEIENYMQDLESGKYAYGYAYMTDEADSDGERITEEAFKEAIDSLTNKPYNKVFLIHNYQKIAVGRVVMSYMNSEGYPVVLCKLNENLKDIDEIWGSIKDGYLDSFSIGGRFTDFHLEQEDGRDVVVVTGLELYEISLVSMPASEGASIVGAFQKAYKYLKTGDSKMVKNKKKEAELKEEVENSQAQDVQGSQTQEESKENQTGSDQVQEGSDGGDESTKEKSGNEKSEEVSVEGLKSEVDAIKKEMEEIKDLMKNIESKFEKQGDGSEEESLGDDEGIPGQAKSSDVRIIRKGVGKEEDQPGNNKGGVSWLNFLKGK